MYLDDVLAGANLVQESRLAIRERSQLRSFPFKKVDFQQKKHS